MLELGYSLSSEEHPPSDVCALLSAQSRQDSRSHWFQITFTRYSQLTVCWAKT